MKETNAELAVKWYRSRDINAYADDEQVFIILDNEDETHILVANDEVDYRAQSFKDDLEWLEEEDDF